MGTKAFYNGRKFLNSKSSDHSGWMSIRVSADMYGLDGIISISDCYRKAELTLDGRNKRELNNSINKIDKMISLLEGARDELENAYDHYLKEKARKVNKESYTHRLLRGSPCE
jgi:hypothetical protein